jgi:hypothetical protein
MTTDDHDADAAMVGDDEDYDAASVWGLDMPVPDFAGIARLIQNRASRRVGLDATEARRFREFFGTSVRVVGILWEFLVRDELRPRGGRPWHLLWALYFLKVYAKEGPGCAVVGGAHGGVDPKTYRKWVWAFIEAISELVDLVVSFLI